VNAIPSALHFMRKHSAFMSIARALYSSSKNGFGR